MLLSHLRLLTRVYGISTISPNSDFRESTTPVYLAIYGCCRQRPLSLLAMCVLASTMSSEQCGRDSVSAHVQLSCVYLASTLNVTHVIKYTRLSPSLAGRAWEQSYILVHMVDFGSVILRPYKEMGESVAGYCTSMMRLYLFEPTCRYRLLACFYNVALDGGSTLTDPSTSRRKYCKFYHL